MRKAHIRLYGGYMAIVRWPGNPIQRTFGFYSTTAELFSKIRDAGEPT